jgi:predicted ATPase/DNA-binding SARP family transcriptional activator
MLWQADSKGEVMEASLALYFLGHPHLLLGNLPLVINRRAVLALLAYLTVNNRQIGQKYTRESLSALLWPDLTQFKAFTNLRHTLWEIQKAFGPGWLVADRETIGLRTDANIWVDVHQFESLLSESQAQSDVSLRVPLLTDSVKLYRHHFLAGFILKSAPTFEEWSLAKSDQLEHKLTQALTLLTEDYCLLGDAESAIPYARRLVTLDPLNESAHRLLMQVYFQAGQHNAALKQYQSFEQLLRKELGLDPQPETRALYKQIRKGELKRVPVGIQRETITPQNNLPQQVTSFIGRETQQAEIMHLFDRNRLITLAGPGGIGKTRLSLQVAGKVLDQFPDGVWFIELAPLTNPDLIAQTILSILHLGEQSGKTPLMVLEEQLIHKKLLLILDNCEHLIAGSARVAHALLKTTSEVKILATTREVMSIGEEIAWRVPSLELPDPKAASDQLSKYESVSLFVERALSVQPHLDLNETNMLAIAQICSRLDGIPLAIELAAARVNALGVKQIARRLDDRFRLLTKGSHIVLERHQTLRAAIDWSYNLLGADEKKLLARLSVFMGGWTLEAAEQVCVHKKDKFEVLDVLSNLIDKSLVTINASTDEARYHLLETTRQYALEKLGESAKNKIWHDQHLEYFVDFAEKSHSEIKGSRQAEVLDLLDAELDNLRAALDWCVSNQYIKPALQMLGALGWAWDMRGYYNEVRSWFEKIRIQGNCDDYPEAYARLLNHLGRFAADFDHRPDAESILEQSRALWLGLGKRGEYGLADVLCFLGMNAMNRGEVDKAEPFYTECHELAKKCNNQRIIAASTRFLGDVQWTRGNLPEALNLYEQSLEYSQRIGDLLIISIAAGQLGYLFLELGNYEKARSLFEQALQIKERLRFRFGLANTYIGMCDLSRRQGDYIEAEQWLEKGINISRDLGMKDRMAFDLYFYGLLALYQKDYASATTRFKDYFDFDHALNEKISLCRFLTGIAAIAAETNQSERCAKLFGAAQAAIERTSDFQMDPFDRAEFDRHFQIPRDQLGNAKFEALASEGRTMSTEQAIELATKPEIDQYFNLIA